MAGSHQHRSTLKKSQKGFKSRHATKGALKTQKMGKCMLFSAASILY